MSWTYWTMLETIQNIALRIITDLSWYVRNATIQNSVQVKMFKQEVIKSTKRLHRNIEPSNHAHLNNIGKTIRLREYKPYSIVK